MTLLEEFKTNLAKSNNYSRKNIINLFDVANEKITMWINRGITDDEIVELFDFGQYFEKKYEDYTREERVKKYGDKEPLLIDQYRIISTLIIDRKFLEEISKKIKKDKVTKIDIFEMNLFKKELLRIFNQYGEFCMKKNIHFKIGDQDIEFENEIFIINEEIITQTLLEKNYLTIFLINCILCTHGVVSIIIDDKILIPYYFSNGTWMPIKEIVNINQPEFETVKYVEGKRNY